MSCIFCKLANGEIPSAKFWENKDFAAILDINPNTKGMTIVVSKKHLSPDILEVPDSDLTAGIVAAKKAAAMLKKALNPGRIGIVIEGLLADHFHIKLYPLYDVEDYIGTAAEGRVFNEKYQGYMTTKLGPQWSKEQLDELCRTIVDGNR
jgi:histidine triad (HIT) family protein